MRNKRSFFEQFTGAVNVGNEEDFEDNVISNEAEETEENQIMEQKEEGQLMVDIYQTTDELIIQSMVAGVSPDDLHVSITREVVTISGNRGKIHDVHDEDYFYKELFWGPFSRTISLPREIEPEGVEAIEKNGLLTIRLPKVDKDRQQEIKVKAG